MDILSKQAILDIVSINSFITDGQKNETVNYQNYTKTVKPKIEDFKSKHKKTPNLLLKDTLLLFRSQLEEPYHLQNYGYYGNNKLREYTWSCLYYKFPNVENLYASYSPQLFILVNSKGIKFGISYGKQLFS